MPVADFTPDLDMVGALMRTRTVNSSGAELGTFTSDTRPTDDEVEILVDQAARDLVDEVGEDLPEVAWGSAKSLVTVRTGMKIELSYFPEQIGTNRSPYPQLRQEWIDGIPRLQKAVAAQADEAEGSEAVIGPGSPSYSFPVNKGGMIGWDTKF